MVVVWCGGGAGVPVVEWDPGNWRRRQKNCLMRVGGYRVELRVTVGYLWGVGAWRFWQKWFVLERYFKYCTAGKGFNFPWFIDKLHLVGR